MNNLTQNQEDAKRFVLNRQQAKMLAHYRQSGPKERAAIIKQVDFFLPVLRSDGERIFWLRFRYRLERMNEQTMTNKGDGMMN